MVIVSDAVICFVRSCTGVSRLSESSTLITEASYAFETSVNSLHSTVLFIGYSCVCYVVLMLHCLKVSTPPIEGFTHEPWPLVADYYRSPHV